MSNRHYARSFVTLSVLVVVLSLTSIAMAATGTTYDVYAGESIQDAIDGAASGDVIIVHPGTYDLVDYLSIQDKDLHLQGEDPDSSTVVAATTITGTGTLLRLEGTVTSATIIEGLTFSNSGSSSANGIIYVDGAGPTIRKNVITGANTSGYGGGIYLYGGTATIEANTITANSAQHGGGIYAADSSLTIRNNTISDNVATGTDLGGGGIALTGDGAHVVEGNTITGNTANSSAEYGGGLYAEGITDLTVDENTFSGNSAEWGGAAFVGGIEDVTTLTMTDNTISENTCIAGHPGVELANCDATITGNTIDNNDTTEVGAGGLYAGTGNHVIDGNTITNNAAGWQGAGGLDTLDATSAQITNNTITGNSGEDGGGLQCGSNTTVSGNTITDNTAAQRGGGLFAFYGTDLIIDDNTISRNTARDGGGVCLYECSFTLSSNTVEDNVASREGGGARVSGVTATITANEFSGNQAAGWGGGLWAGTFDADRSITCSDNTYEDNHAIGDAGKGWAGKGGAIWAGRSISFTDETITSCSAAGYGGGFQAGADIVTIDRCSITGCSATYGGGIASSDGTALTLTRTTVSGSSATDAGGGLYVEGSTVVDGCRILDNEAGTGGAIRSLRGLTVTSSLLAGNTATVADPGIRVDEGLTLTGSTLANNTGPGAAVNYANGWDAVIRDCIIASGCQYGIQYSSYVLPVVSYSCVWGHAVANYQGMADQTGSNGNISADPLFADPASDWHLQSPAGRYDAGTAAWVTTDTAYSPCIDAADPASAFVDEPDYNGGRRNMGFYGNTAEASKSSSAATDAKPTVSINYPSDGANIAGQQIEVGGTAHDDVRLDKVRVRVNGGEWCDAEGSFDATGDGSWKAWVTLQSGANLIEARARDRAWQWGPIASITVNGAADLKPVAHFSTPREGATICNLHTVVTGTASDDSAVAKVVMRVNGGAWFDAIGTTSWSASLPTVAGMMVLEVRARDNAGQWGPIATRAIQGDAGDLKPCTEITAPTDGATVATAQVQVTGTAADDVKLAKVVVRVNGGAWVIATGKANWSASVSLVAGANLIEARAQDVASQWGPIVSVTVTRDGGSGPAQVAGLVAQPSAIGGQLSFTLSAGGAVTAEVLNIAGRPIRTIVEDRQMPAGLNTLLWDGRSNQGLSVPNGTYLIRLTTRTDGGAQAQGLTTLQVTR